MGKEHNVCLQLKKWFNTYGIACFLNQGENKFTTKLSQKKPDLIIYSSKLNQHIAIEVKVGNCSKDLYDASKIIEYWENYENKNIEYYIDCEQIQISSFAVATLFSQFGKLFYNYNKVTSIDDNKNDKWKYYCKTHGLEPLWEYDRTTDYIRNLWSQWRKKRERKKQAGLGVILSNVLNQKVLTESIGNPLLFDMQWEEQKNKYKWQNRQKVL